MSLFLKTYCRIKEGEVHVNGELFCQHMDDEPFLKSLYKHLGLSYPKFFKMDDLTQLGFIGSEMTLLRSEMDDYSDEDVALAFSNRSASGKTDTNYNETLRSGIASPSLFVYTLPNVEVGEICIKHKLYGENNFFITERFNAKLLLDHCQTLFDDNAAKAVLIAWTEVDSQKSSDGGHDGFFAFITPSGNNEVTEESLTDIYLDR